MSSIALESSNSLEMDITMTKSEHVMVTIPCNQPINDYINRVGKEWVDILTGKETTKSYERERHMEKLPLLLLKSEKGSRNSDCYKPTVVSLGPYHHNHPALAQAEKYKLITLEEYRLHTGKPIAFLYNKVFEVVYEARKCYIDGSTDAYSNEEFNQMMLRDACFILSYIEKLSCGHQSIFLNHEYLGAIGLANVMRDLFLLENQIPFVVLEVLLKLKFPEDKGEDILNKFFNYLNYGEVMIRKDKKVLEYKQPLHLLELYRSYFISLNIFNGLHSSKIASEEKDSHEDYNYVKRSRSFASVMQLKGRWVFLRCTSDESPCDMEFYPYRFYGEFKLARRTVSSYTKAIYLNMIAYEMCMHNPNDYRVSTFIRVMKSLIKQRLDVKELRHKGILLHNLGDDDEVATMYDEIEVAAVNIFMYNHIRGEIEKLHASKYKRWVAELITDYLGSPWKAVGLLVAAAILVTGFVQTHFAINPREK